MRSIFLLLLATSPLFSQGVSVLESDDLVSVVTVAGVKTTDEVKTYSVDYDGDGVADYQDVIESKQTKSVKHDAKLIVVNTKANNIRVVAEGKDFQTVPLFSPGKGKYLLANPGRYRIRVTVVDFDLNIFDEWAGTVTLGKTPNPDDDSGDDSQDDEETDPNIENTYGLGAVAKKYRPAEATAEHLSEVFRKAGDYLFGIPTLKVVSSANSNNPDVNVIAWLDRELSKCQADDCKTFRKEIWEAFRQSQKKRQYSRQDWYNAFQEVSRALK